jgi:ankyrin repeat protein
MIYSELEELKKKLPRPSPEFLVTTKNGQLNAVKEYVEREKPILNTYPQSCLHQCGSHEVFEYLVSMKADPNLRNRLGQTPLISSIQDRRSTVFIRAVLKFTDDVNVRDIKGRTAIYWAATHAPVVIRDLLLRNALVNAPEFKGRRPIFQAVLYGGGEAVAALVKSSVLDVQVMHPTTKMNVLMYASFMGNARLMLQALKRKVNPNLQSASGLTALHFVAISGNLEAVPMLLQYGADLNILDNQGYPALGRAIEREDQQMVYLFLAAGTSVDSFNPGAQSLLMKAAMTGKPEIVDLLLWYGASRYAPMVLRDKAVTPHIEQMLENAMLYDAANERAEAEFRESGAEAPNYGSLTIPYGLQQWLQLQAEGKVRGTLGGGEDAPTLPMPSGGARRMNVDVYARLNENVEDVDLIPLEEAMR